MDPDVDYIDRALADYAEHVSPDWTSPDAMRWQPGAAPDPRAAGASVALHDGERVLARAHVPAGTIVRGSRISVFPLSEDGQPEPVYGLGFVTERSFSWEVLADDESVVLHAGSIPFDIAPIRDRTETLRRTFEEIGAAVSQLVDPLRTAVEQVGLLEKPLPDEPRARALEAKRRQGKGPGTPKDWRHR